MAAVTGAETISHGTVVVVEAIGEMEEDSVTMVVDSVTMEADSETMAEEIGETIVTAAATEEMGEVEAEVASVAVQ